MKYFLLWMLLMILPGGIALAETSKINLSAHGSDLSKSTFAMRYKFSKEKGKSWSEADYAERKAFLQKWYEDIDKERKLQQEKNKQEMEARKTALQNKKEKQRQSQERIKARQDAQREEKKAEAQRLKDARQKMKEASRRIQGMRQNQRNNR